MKETTFIHKHHQKLIETNKPSMLSMLQALDKEIHNWNPVPPQNLQLHEMT